MVFALKPDGTWHICWQIYDYRGLNTTTLPAVEPLPDIDTLLDSGVVLLHQAQSRQQLPPAPGTVVDDEFPAAAGPVRVRRGTFRAAGIVLTSDALHGTFAGCLLVHSGSARTVWQVRAGAYARLFGPFADAGTASPG